MKSIAKKGFLLFLTVAFFQLSTKAQQLAVSTGSANTPMNALASTENSSQPNELWASNAEMYKVLPKLGIKEDKNGELLRIANPDGLKLSIEVKNENGTTATEWMLESLSDSDQHQTLNVSALKQGVYWIEIAAPDYQSSRLKWTKQ